MVWGSFASSGPGQQPRRTTSGLAHCPCFSWCICDYIVCLGKSTTKKLKHLLPKVNYFAVNLNWINLSSVGICSLCLSSFFSPFVGLVLYKWERIPRTTWVQRKSAVHRRHQQERRLNTAQSGSVQWQRNLLLWCKEPARCDRNPNSNWAQSCAKR